MRKITILIFIILIGIVATACQPMEKPSEILETLYDMIEIGYVSPDTIDSVTQNITLETNYEGYENVEITWISNSDTISIEGNTGIVTRPESNSLVRLSATLKLSGARKTKHFALIVLSRDEKPDSSKPVITGYKNHVITIGDNMPNFLEGVSAKDSLNNSINVEIVSNNVNINLVGVYEVALRARDLLNNQTTITIQVTVKDKNTPINFEGYYTTLNGLTGSSLQTELYSILNNTGTYPTTTYGEARDILLESDRWVTFNDNYIYLVYTDTLKGSVKSGYPDQGYALPIWNPSNTWNREHVWAKSLFGSGGYDPGNSTRGIDADMHNLRAADTNVNSTRNNNTFINQIYRAEGFGNYNSMWYPGDHHRGDVARILFYMDIRWGTLTDLSKIADLETLLEWHILDPVDDFEIHRNNVIFSYQNNRNPFIDYPELVEIIYS